MEIEEDSRQSTGSLGLKGRGEGEVLCRRRVLILPTDSRLLGSLPHKPNSPLCGMSRGPYMDTLFPHRSPFFFFFCPSSCGVGDDTVPSGVKGTLR